MAIHESELRRYMEPPKDTQSPGTAPDSKNPQKPVTLRRRIASLWEREIPVIDDLVGKITEEEERAKKEGRTPRVPFSTDGFIPYDIAQSPTLPTERKMTRRALLRLGAGLAGTGLGLATGIGILASRSGNAAENLTPVPSVSGIVPPDGPLLSPPTETPRPAYTVTTAPTHTATLVVEQPPVIIATPKIGATTTSVTDPSTLGEKPLTEQEKKEIAKKIVEDLVKNGMDIQLSNPQAFGVDKIQRSEQYILPQKIKDELAQALHQYGIDFPQVSDAILGEVAYTLLLFGNINISKKSYPNVDYVKLNNTTLSEHLTSLVKTRGNVEIYSSNSEEDSEPATTNIFYAGNGYINTLIPTGTEYAVDIKGHGTNIIECTADYAQKAVVEPDPDNLGTNRFRSYTYLSNRYMKGIQTIRAAGGGNTQIISAGGAFMSISKFPEFINGGERFKTTGEYKDKLKGRIDVYEDIIMPQTTKIANGQETVLFAGKTRQLIKY